MKYNDNGEWKDIQVKVANAIQNEYGESNNDGYSQNYLNDKVVNVGTSVDNRSRVNVLKSNNLFNKDSVVVGYINADGSINSSDTNYKTSDFIPVKPNTTYYITASGTSRAKYFNSSKTPLNTSSYQDIDIGASAGSFTTPANCYYIRKSMTNARLDDLMLNKGATALPYEPYITPSIYVDNEEIYSKPVVLWQNSSPTSNFAGQTITLSDSLDNYLFYEISFYNSTSNTQSYSTGKIKSNVKTTLYYLSGLESGGNPMIRYRDITGITSTTITFGTPYYKQLNQTSITEGSNQTVPYQVIGYK